MYAQVIVDITHTQVDQLFDYSIPPELEIKAGMRVLVPFGARSAEGIVIAVSGATDYPANKIKPIVKALEDYAALTEEQIGLARFIAEQYNTTMASALRFMIPAQLRGGKVTSKTRNVARLQLTGAELDEAMQSLYKADGTEKYPRQIEVLRALADAPDGLPTATLNASAVKSLAKKGWVSTSGEEVARQPFREPVPLIPDYELTDAQQQILDEIAASQTKKFLLHGVTGSGKTEIYIRVMRQCLSQGKTAIMLVPEISLTAQTYRFLKQRFDEDIAVFHSGLSAGERYDEWLKVKRGQAKIVLGARSAVFAPLEQIGVIIIDEEHETSYKADQYPKYTAHEVAEKRCELNGATLILGSATPQVETYYRARQGELVLLNMPERLFGLPLPKVTVVDMRTEMQEGNRSAISGRLHAVLEQTLQNKKQAMLFLNRRGYSTFVMCRGCGYMVQCKSCDITMTYHKTQDVLKCHYCGKTETPVKLCPECGKPYLKYFGTGTQQIEEQVKELFPAARVMRMDVDTMSKKDAYLRVFDEFAAGKADILLGTQMITKGFDFEGVHLSAILAADTMLSFPDYRSAERTFSQITQVAGRAGRKESGEVILQTYNPEHYAVEYAKNHDFEGFYEAELEMRRNALLPPFSTFIQIQMSGEREEDVIAVVKDFINRLKRVLLPHKSDIISIRAAQSAIRRIRDAYRYHILVCVRRTEGLLDGIYDVFHHAKYKNVLTGIDINPVNMA